MEAQAIIWTEGKTDWQHLKRAFGTLLACPRIAFHEDENAFGDDQLLKQCAATARILQPVPTIFVFDRDNDQTVNRVADASREFKAWGNNVYSFAIPTPPHRIGESGVCIELYYTDEELRTKDNEGRRLFLSTEFNPTSGRLQADPTLNIANKGRLPSAKSALTRIIDSEVYDEQSQNVALSKAEFAHNVFHQVAGFASFNFDSFRSILSVIDKVIEDACRGNNLAFGDTESFVKGLDNLDTPHQLASIIETAIHTCKLATMVFIAATLRHYEQTIIGAAGDVRKVRPIRQLLADNFSAPSLVTLQKLARNCYHLIDQRAPSVLATLRSTMTETLTLGPLGDMLEELERVLPPARSPVRTLRKRDLKKSVLDYLIPELAKYEGRIHEITETVAASGALRAEASPATWYAALTMLINIFTPLRDVTLRVRSLERVRSTQTSSLGV